MRFDHAADSLLHPQSYLSLSLARWLLRPRASNNLHLALCLATVQ